MLIEQSFAMFWLEYKNWTTAQRQHNMAHQTTQSDSSLLALSLSLSLPLTLLFSYTFILVLDSRYSSHHPIIIVFFFLATDRRLLASNFCPRLILRHPSPGSFPERTEHVFLSLLVYRTRSAQQFVVLNSGKMEEHSRFEVDSVFVALLARKRDTSSCGTVSTGWRLRYKTFGPANWTFLHKSTRNVSRSLAAQWIVGHVKQSPQDPPEGALSDKTGCVARIQAGLGSNQRTWSRRALITRHRLRGCHLIVRMIAIAQHRVNVLHVAEFLKERYQVE